MYQTLFETLFVLLLLVLASSLYIRNICTRLAIPLYIFGCHNNFIHIKPDKSWCVCLAVFIGIQAVFVLLQHYLGSCWFIHRQVSPDSLDHNQESQTPPSQH
ncbi:hypothetical protein MtrunA17_Chr3g0128611 [Medicago truncatula]|uniref:RING-type E3 ubiquitin transferase n=1 Tax=Medicago truncatula TaxID=3880 RepID=A0A396IW61_MEDTR|nr:hypothetical protein MtrunA17_Chr3g0128611 [Medicago truncatula]